MSFLDDLQRAAESPASVWHQFVVAHKSGRDEWYVFLEGKLDVPFYVQPLRLLIDRSSRISEFRCGGKRGVYRVRGEVRTSHPTCTRCLFFVDKDLQEFVGESYPDSSDIFCTSGYSIENYLVSDEALEVVWSQLWAMPTADPRLPVVKVQFTRAHERLCRAMLPIMSWAVLARVAGLRPNMNNVNPAEILALKDGLPCRASDAIDRIRKASSCDFRPSLAQWVGENRRLAKADPKAVIRGKFELWFFCRFLDFVFQRLAASPGQKPNGSIQASADSVARALIGKIETPPALLGFLKAAVEGSGTGHCQDGV